MNYVKTTAKINDGYDEHAIYRLCNVHYVILLSTTEEYRSKEKLQNALLTMAENNRLSMRNNYRTLSCLMYIFIMFIVQGQLSRIRHLMLIFVTQWF